MVSSTRQAIAGILVIFCAALLARAQTVQPKEPTSTITGKVTIKDKPVAGIFIGLRPQESSPRRQLTRYRATTDSDGKYRIENVIPGSYVVIPVAPAYISEEVVSERTLIINKAETIDNVDFVLLRGGAITGRVVDGDGHPLIEVDVVAVAEPQNARAQMRYLGTRTDDRGIYRLFGLPAGRYKLAAGNENYSPYRLSSHKRTFHPGVENEAEAAFIEVSEGSETNDIDITLTGVAATYTASGRIIDAQTGQPVPNVFYAVTHYQNEYRSTSGGPAIPTNSRGEFRLQHLSPGKYGITARDRSKGEWYAEEVQFEVVDRDVTDLVIKTERAASISGVVVMEGVDEKVAREQLTKAHVSASIMNESTGRGYGSSAMPAADGSFRITGLGPGTAGMQVYAPTGQFRIARLERNGVIQTRGIELKPGEHITGIRVVVNHGSGAIRGTVTVENGAIPAGGRLFIWLRRISDDQTDGGSWTDATPQLDSRGQFRVDNVFPGTYELNIGVAMPDGRPHVMYKKQEVVITAGSNNNVNITVDLNSPITRP